MAYVSAEVIANARTAMKKLNNEYDVKATVSGVNTSTLKLQISSGCIDFISNYLDVRRERNWQYAPDEQQFRWYGFLQVNHYYLDDAFSGKALEYLQKASAILHAEHWDKSDIQTDYFNCSFYVNIHIGKWNKPYIYCPAA